MPAHGVFVRDQARAAGVHHDVVVLADDGPSGTERYELRADDEDGLRVLRLTYRPTRRGNLIAAEYVAGVLAAIRRLIAEGRRPDVLHAHVYNTGIAALIAGRRYRIPVVVSEHSSHFVAGTLGRSGTLRARVVFRAADLVCPVSDFLRWSIEQRGLHGRFRVVPNAIDSDLFAAGLARPRRDNLGRVRVLVVAGLQPVKGVATLLQAVAAVAARRDDFHVDVIGDGPERAACERVLHEHGIRPFVTLHGYLPKVDVAAWLRRSGFLALPSRTETFGVAAVEAMAAGRPVLAARVGALPSLIDDDAGILVDQPSKAALIDGLDAMLDRFGEFDSARLSARAVARFGSAAVAAEWDQVYRGVVAARDS